MRDRLVSASRAVFISHHILLGSILSCRICAISLRVERVCCIGADAVQDARVLKWRASGENESTETTS